MTDHFIRVYSERAADYHRLIAAEDADGNLLRAIRQVARPEGRRVLDLGTGTGRIPLLLGGLPALTVGVDLHWDMLRQHRLQQQTAGGAWPLVRADIRALPFASGAFEIVTAGWALGHFCGWYADHWPAQIGRALLEMERMAATGGILLIFETLSTGSFTPAPPTPALGEYYAWLEAEHGFRRTTLSTDYEFESAAQASAFTEFFFGPELSHKIVANGWKRVPEWTGMWSKQQA